MQAIRIWKIDEIIRPGSIQKSKVPFNSVKSLVEDRHLYFDFENSEREEVSSAYIFVTGILSENNSDDSDVPWKLMMTGLI